MINFRFRTFLSFPLLRTPKRVLFYFATARFIRPRKKSRPKEFPRRILPVAMWGWLGDPTRRRGGDSAARRAVLVTPTYAGPRGIHRGTPVYSTASPLTKSTSLPPSPPRRRRCLLHYHPPTTTTVTTASTTVIIIHPCSQCQTDDASVDESVVYRASSRGETFSDHAASLSTSRTRRRPRGLDVDGRRRRPGLTVLFLVFSLHRSAVRSVSHAGQRATRGNSRHATRIEDGGTERPARSRRRRRGGPTLEVRGHRPPRGKATGLLASSRGCRRILVVGDDVDVRASR